MQSNGLNYYTFMGSDLTLEPVLASDNTLFPFLALTPVTGSTDLLRPFLSFYFLSVYLLTSSFR